MGGFPGAGPTSLLGQNNTWTGPNQFNAQANIVAGLFIQNGLRISSNHLVTTTTLTSGYEIVYADMTSAAYTVSLPATPTASDTKWIKQINATVNNLTISGNGQNIDGAASLVLTANLEAVFLHYDPNGAAWWVIGQVATTIL